MTGARERLVELLRASHGQLRTVDEIADFLLPVVQRIADERAAEALEQAMREDRTTVAKLSAVEQLTCFVVKGEDLLARAASLRADTLRAEESA